MKPSVEATGFYKQTLTTICTPSTRYYLSHIQHYSALLLGLVLPVQLVSSSMWAASSWQLTTIAKGAGPEKSQRQKTPLSWQKEDRKNSTNLRATSRDTRLHLRVCPWTHEDIGHGSNDACGDALKISKSPRQEK